MKEILLKSFSTVTEAESAENLLKQYNIKSIVKRKGLIGAFGNQDILGADLFVAERDFVEAKAILGEKKEG